VFFLKGLLIGFAIAAPVGPIGVLCIRRTFAEGRAAGFATGLGAATADAFYGAVAGFGLTAVSAFLLGFQSELRLGGGVFLCALGLKTFLSRPAAAGARMQGRGLAQAYATTVVLTLTNPATILSFIAVFAGAGLGQQRAGTAEALAIVTGVFLGSAAWWLALSGFVDGWRRRHPEFAAWAPNPVGGAVVTGVTLGVAQRELQRVNQVSGVLLFAFGAYAVASSRGAIMDSAILRDFSSPMISSTSFSAKASAVPGPWLVMQWPSTTTGASI
jgi:threonine/homoserine/homoserine lactone efflux protein